MLPTHPVLVVDDDPEIRNLVAAVLDLEGYLTLTAGNGAEALWAIKRERPACMLLDMRMPVMNGWDLAQALHQQGLDLPIVVMTAARHAQQWCDEIGAAGCLPKPFELDQLLDTLARACPEQPPHCRI